MNSLCIIKDGQKNGRAKRGGVHQYVGPQSDIGANGSRVPEDGLFFDQNGVTTSVSKFDAPQGDCAKIFGLPCSVTWSEQLTVTYFWLVHR